MIFNYIFNELYLKIINTIIQKQNLELIERISKCERIDLNDLKTTLLKFNKDKLDEIL
jgi:hypothetical protein